ncbi:MAG: hypothetical protein QME96_01730 [Myxococcota bacterium]|nr:hypothetical protein [Myxococcota bacterium]
MKDLESARASPKEKMLRFLRDQPSQAFSTMELLAGVTGETEQSVAMLLISTAHRAAAAPPAPPVAPTHIRHALRDFLARFDEPSR